MNGLTNTEYIKETLVRRKEVLFAVIGGVIGAILTMAVGSIAPLGAQNELKDAEFGTLTCRTLRVGYNDHLRLTKITPFSIEVSQPNGRRVLLHARGVNVDGENGKGGALMIVNEDGGFVSLKGTDGDSGGTMAIGEYGGFVSVYGRGNDYARAKMGVNEYGNGAVSTWDKNRYRLATLK